MKNNLRVLLAKKEMNMQDLHDVTGISRTTISNIYNKRAINPGYPTLRAIANALECTVDELMGGVEHDRKIKEG